MNELTLFWRQYPHITGWILTGVLNAAITALPSPGPNSNPAYRWFFDFTHGVLLLIPRIIQTRKAAAAAGGSDNAPDSQ